MWRVLLPPFEVEFLVHGDDGPVVWDAPVDDSILAACDFPPSFVVRGKGEAHFAETEFPGERFVWFEWDLFGWVVIMRVSVDGPPAIFDYLLCHDGLVALYYNGFWASVL